MARLTTQAGIAVFAITAALAVAGAGTASATRLCEAEGVLKACPAGKVLPAATPLKFVQKVKSVFKAGVEVECNESTWAGETTGAGGGAGAAVPGTLKKEAWGLCSCPTAAIGPPWEVKFDGAGNRDGDMTYEVEVEFNCAGVACRYSGEPESPVKGGKPAILEVAAELVKVAGGFLCANVAKWTATYEITAPFPMFITEA